MKYNKPVRNVFRRKGRTMAGKKKIISVLLILCFLTSPGISAYGDWLWFFRNWGRDNTEPTSAPISETAPELEAEPKVIEDSALRGALVISEIMAKNHATLSDEDGEQPDWIELHNISSDTIDLSGFTISDDPDSGWSIPRGTVASGDYFIIYADGKDRAGAIPHADFSLSAGETVVLRDAEGRFIDSVKCECDTADYSQMLEESGEWTDTVYPSPGFPNTGAGYDAWQDTLFCSSPLVISEVMTYNTRFFKQNYLEYCDWVELKNVSDYPVELSDYYLSDDEDELKKFRLPQRILNPGKTAIIICTEKAGEANEGFIKAPFGLSAEREQLYLSRDDGLNDYVFLRDIPFGCSYGRETGRNGWFFFAEPKPETEKSNGYRRISKTPESPCYDGIFNGVFALCVELSGKGDIYYTTDGSLPTTNSKKYDRPFDITETCVVRAVALEQGAMMSRPLNLSFIINENHTLPVVSISTDSPYDFKIMYNSKRKDVELQGSIAFYDGDSSFTMPCGIDMQGDTSLNMRKKSLNIHFRGAYGKSTLEYDLFGGGVTRFGSLIVRAGQDYYNSIIKNELGENLCLKFSDSVMAQRNRYCILYINGKYQGIYSIMEKMNESHYAEYRNVDEDSVTVRRSPVSYGYDFYQEIVDFSKKTDLTVKENYDEFCRRMDIDSLIDWLIVEGYTANTDLHQGNVRWGRSTEDDGRWRPMLYDMDSIFTTNMNCFNTVLSRGVSQYSTFVPQLIQVPEFREKFLTRAAEVFKDQLSDESVLAEIDRLAAEIEPEVPRDYGRFNLSVDNWKASVQAVRALITDWHWQQSCIKSICEKFGGDSEKYFR